MSIALFIDVDGVLTDEPVNLQLARLLNEENSLNQIENDFKEGKISNEEFNKKFIPLFQKSGFCKQYLENNFHKIRMRIGYKNILKSENVYLVSSGPSYFVDELAKNFKIPGERTLCSRYEFDNDGILKSCTLPVSNQTKAAFVSSHARNYDITIGIGDSPSLDAAFLSHCSIKILMDEFRTGYLCVKDLDALSQIIHNIPKYFKYSNRHFGDILTTKQPGLCFVIMPFKASWSDSVYKIIKATLEEKYTDIIIKRADDLYGQDVMCDIWKSIQNAEVIIAEVTNRNPNVFYELGIAHAMDKNVIILSQNDKDIPFDLNRFRHFIYSNDLDGSQRLKKDLIDAYNDMITTKPNTPRPRGN